MNPFPIEKLRPTDSALVLFCAHFGGVQDAANYRDAGLTRVACVDLSAEKLEAMQPNYPNTWTFHDDDAFHCIDETPPRSYDVVSCDQFTNHDADVLKRVPKLLKIATRLVLVSFCAGGSATLADLAAAMRAGCEKGWTVETRLRTTFKDGVFWVIFEKRTA